MTAYVALLRAVNVGGRNLLMSDLTAIAQELRLGSPRTFIARGNLLFTSTEDEPVLQERLETRFAKHMGAPVPVLIRTATEMEAFSPPIRSRVSCPEARLSRFSSTGGCPRIV
jgi:uncharacterized protein (DUF1697 family)